MVSTPSGRAPGERATAGDAPVADPGVGAAGAGAVPAPEALRIMAAMTLSPAPAFLRAMRAFVEVSYVPGEELMVLTTRSSERPALISLTTESLLSDSCAKRTWHRNRKEKIRIPLRID